MAKREFVQNFANVTEFFGLNADEHEALKTLCRGNMDAAEHFMALMAGRIRTDPRFGINERIKASIAKERILRDNPEQEFWRT